MFLNFFCLVRMIHIIKFFLALQVFSLNLYSRCKWKAFRYYSAKCMHLGLVHFHWINAWLTSFIGCKFQVNYLWLANKGESVLTPNITEKKRSNKLTNLTPIPNLFNGAIIWVSHSDFITSNKFWMQAVWNWLLLAID